MKTTLITILIAVMLLVSEGWAADESVPRPKSETKAVVLSILGLFVQPVGPGFALVVGF